MVSITVNYGIGYNSAYNPNIGTQKDFQGNLGAFGRFAFGYNAQHWHLDISAVYNKITTSTESRLLHAEYGICNIRLNFVKRFIPGSKLTPWLNKIP